MDRIEINDSTPGLKFESKNFEQAAIRDAFKQLSSGFTAIQPSFYLSGCQVTIDTVAGEDTITLTQGVASYNGEPISVPAQNITKLVSEVAWLEENEENVNSVPYTDRDGVPIAVEIQRTLILKKGANYPAPNAHLKLDAPNQIDLIATQLGAKVVQKGAILEVHGWELTWFDSTGLGLVNTRAEGYAICNGNNGTPDKRGVTAVGAVDVPSTGAGSLPDGVDSNYAVGDVFGEESHQLTEAVLPEFTLTYQKGNQIANDADLSGNTYSNNRGFVDANLTFGNNQEHENRQPSRAALFVMVL